MIVDSINNGSKYASLHPHFAKAFEFINSTDLAALEVGKFDIDGENLRALFLTKKEQQLKPVPPNLNAIMPILISKYALEVRKPLVGNQEAVVSLNVENTIQKKMYCSMMTHLICSLV